ncbi:MAG: tetratricopeptide repeat protein [Deltaproteobacteria bacterium]|nr:tetratricopeptide repeat protein [Deltaproteobacteria bacterium]
MSIIYDAIKKIHGSNQKEKSASYYFEDKNRRKPFLVKIAIILAVFIFAGIGLIYGFKLFSLDVKVRKEVPGQFPLPTGRTSAQMPPKPSFEKAVELNKKGMDFFREKKFIDAKSSFEAALQIDPNYAEAYNNLGLTYKQMGSLEMAKKNYEEAIRMKKDYPEALNNYGLLLSSMGDDKKSVEYFKMAIGSDKDYADAFLNMAIVLERQSNIREAREAYKNFIILAKKKGVDEHMINEVKKHIAEIDRKIGIE